MKKYDKLFKKSSLPSLHIHLVNRYGLSKGNLLYKKTGARLLYLINHTDDRGSAAVRKHINENILPVVSCYQVLVKDGMARQKAQAFAAAQMHAEAKKAGKIFTAMSRLPFSYHIFRIMGQRAMSKNFPVAGWDMQWLQNDKKEMRFDCYRCVYLDITTQWKCPELCIDFCKNDDIVYGVLKPRILFLRTKTLAGGGDCCDFRLANGKYYAG